MPRFRSIATLALVPASLVLLGGPLAAAADESSKAPAQIVRDVQRDLAKVRSYHFSGVQREGRSTTHLAGDVTADGKADFTIREGDASARLIALPPAVYMRANAAFWKASGGANLAKDLAGRWVKVDDKSLAAFAEQLAPDELAACWRVGLGALGKDGVRTVGGKRTVVVTDKGDKAGTAPGRMYVTTAPPILPLRMVQTGKRRRGGHFPKRCADSIDRTSTFSDVRLSRFDEALDIRAPKGAITLPSNGTPS